MITENEVLKQGLKSVAEKMLIAARTAPKGKGMNNLLISIADSDDILEISAKMKEIGERTGARAFIRDSENIKLAPYMLLLAAKINPVNLMICGSCGFKNCAEKNNHPEIPCVFNITDLGIAVGSAVALAADHRVDNRIMYTVGIAVKELGLLGDEAAVIFGIPVSATSKNPFFDR